MKADWIRNKVIGVCERVSVCVWEREREKETDRERLRERETDSLTDRHTVRQKDRKRALFASKLNE